MSSRSNIQIVMRDSVSSAPKKKEKEKAIPPIRSAEECQAVASELFSFHMERADFLKRSRDLNRQITINKKRLAQFMADNQTARIRCEPLKKAFVVTTRSRPRGFSWKDAIVMIRRRWGEQAAAEVERDLIMLGKTPVEKTDYKITTLGLRVKGERTEGVVHKTRS